MISIDNKKLKLLYDDQCVFCRESISLYKKFDVFKNVEIYPLTLAMERTDWNFDSQLSKNKLALYNTDTKQSYYGIHAYMQVIATKYPFILHIAKLNIVILFLDFIYSIIAFNRRLLIPRKCETSCDINPEKSNFYRAIFIILISLVVNYVTAVYFSRLLNPYFKLQGNYTDLLFFFGQLVFQFFVFKFLKQKNFYNYIGHLSFVSFLGAALLYGFYIGIELLQFIGIHTEMLHPLCFGIVIAFMFFEHKKRLEIEKLSKWLSLTWIIYRLIIYPIAFIV